MKPGLCSDMTSSSLRSLSLLPFTLAVEGGLSCHVRVTDLASARIVLTFSDPMTTAPPVHPDARRSNLRTLGARVDLQLDRLATHPTADAEVIELRTAWQDLFGALQLGPEPETRTCPSCGALAMRAATRCGHCWATLTPP